MWRGLLLTFSFWGIGAVVLRATLIPPQVCPTVTAEAALASADEAALWIERAQRPDGTYLYEYQAPDDIDLGGYNIVRHAGVTMSLYQRAAETGDLRDLPAADRGLAWMTASLYRRDGWAAFQGPAGGDLQLGASALMLAALEQRRIATSDTSHDDLMRELGRFLIVMQQPGGAFLASWRLATAQPDPALRSKYATGEAFWALTLLHRFFPGEGWDRPARAVARYLSLYRDEAEGFDFPPWADQWAAYGLAEMASWPLDEDNVAYARRLAERFGFLVRVESQRRQDWWSNLVHGRQARAAGLGTWGEALDSLHHLASVDPRLAPLREKLAERAACAAGLLAGRQVTEARAADYGSPESVRGAWFTGGITRMDDQQHALSALVRAAPILAATKEERR
ncbi:MAG: hypothetical protein DYG91_08630 [Chloroflexi bacterium CFX7]|nr:hypothetical protein [Chloroflexi bacterium CFX7]MCK6563423.1 hypothetical protein [Dehalococcoidia bacterium]MCL4231661.1 hypothetical protein [Dehalococcoidia bacterium]RIL03193.1 MAG: hypothetical protein DCC78_03955 [bacterium]